MIVRLNLKVLVQTVRLVLVMGDTDTDGIDTEYWTKSIPILIVVGGNWAGSKQSYHVF